MPQMWFGDIYVPMWANEEEKKKIKRRGKKPGVIRGVRVRSWMRYCDKCGAADVYERKPTPARVNCPYCGAKKAFYRQLEDYQ